MDQTPPTYHGTISRKFELYILWASHRSDQNWCQVLYPSSEPISVGLVSESYQFISFHSFLKLIFYQHISVPISDPQQKCYDGPLSIKLLCCISSWVRVLNDSFLLQSVLSRSKMESCLPYHNSSGGHSLKNCCHHLQDSSGINDNKWSMTTFADAKMFKNS